MKKIILLGILSLGYLTMSSQTIVSDSEGNELFSFYTGNSLSIELETGKEEVSFNYNLPVYKSFFYYKDEKITDTTLYTSKNIQFGLKFSNSEGDFDYSKIGNNRIGWEATLGFQRSIDKIVNMQKLQDNNQWFWSYGGSFYLKRGNLLFYNPIELSENREKPVSGGINLNLTFYRWIFMVTQFSANVELRKWEVDDLPDFFQNSPTYSNSDIIVFDKTSKGKYGQLITDEFYQLRLANPFFPFHKLSGLPGKISLTPYGVLEIREQSSPEFRYGAMFNILGQNITASKAYKIEKGFGIGLDKSTADDNPVLFLRGTFNFGEINAKSRKPKSKTK